MVHTYVAIFKNINGSPQTVMQGVKNPPVNAGDLRSAGSIAGSWRSPGEGNCNPLQCSSLENPKDRGAW